VGRGLRNWRGGYRGWRDVNREWQGDNLRWHGDNRRWQGRGWYDRDHGSKRRASGGGGHQSDRRGGGVGTGRKQNNGRHGEASATSASIIAIDRVPDGDVASTSGCDDGERRNSAFKGRKYYYTTFLYQDLFAA